MATVPRVQGFSQRHAAFVIARRLLSLTVALSCGLLTLSARSGTVFASLDSSHSNQLQGDPLPLDFESFTISHSDSRSSTPIPGAVFANVSEFHNSTFQEQEFLAHAYWDPRVPTLRALHVQSTHLWGENRNRRWIASFSEFVSQGNFTDRMPYDLFPGNVSLLGTATFFWKLHSTITQHLTLAPTERPLYRIQSDFNFQADARGAKAPINVTSSIYDPHVDAQPPHFGWSLLNGNVDITEQLVPDLADRIVTLEVALEIDPATGRYKPVDLNASFSLTSSHKFLNDGAEFNYDLTGLVSYDFTNSAELLGVLFRDVNGMVVTDVLVSSESGVNYRVLGSVPEPSTWALMIAGLASVALARSRRRLVPVQT